MNKAIVILCVCLLLLCFYFIFEKNQKEDEEEYIEMPIRTGVVMDKYIITRTTVLTGKENRLEQKKYYYIDVLSQGELLRFEIDAEAYGTYDVGEVIEWVR